MYSYEWDRETHGYILNNQMGHFVANEIRPVFVAELAITGLGKRFIYDQNETRPLMWAQKNTYLVDGQKVAQLHNTQYGKPLDIEYFFDGKMQLEPVDINTMVEINTPIMDIVAADAKRRAKELYDEDIKRCDIAYIAFSGGKDSVVLLDICHRVLPFSVPVIFSDTDMELPDTYKIWHEIQQQYPEREFIIAKAERSALENWQLFGPPARTIRWCCSVHKSTPAIIMLKEKLHKPAIKVMAFVGVRGDESISRSFYEDSTDGVKNASQLNRMPILDWGAHELWLYIFANNLLINEAYKSGLNRVGCIMCPESSEKYEWFVDKIYPKSVKLYKDVIFETSSKSFKNKEDKDEFIGKRYWQARRSGAVLKEIISAPFQIDKGLSVTFQSPHFSNELFEEWIKTLGMVEKERDNGKSYLKIPNELDAVVFFSYIPSASNGGNITFEFSSELEKIRLLPRIKELLRKVSACIGCGCCEAQCPQGAITTTQCKIQINALKCIRCYKCYKIANSCWRYISMYKTENSKGTLNTIAGYRNFGLRENWIDVLLEMGDTFFAWDSEHTLGKDMVESAKRWFPQALIVDDKTKNPTQLVELFRKKGTQDKTAWDMVWIALANNSSLVKWFILHTEVEKKIDVTDLLNLLKADYPMTNNTKDRRLDPLKNTFLETPLGKDNGVVELEKKGKQVKAITRKEKNVNSLGLLYGLYLIANQNDRTNFTVRELISANEDSSFISPIVAFGISPEDFKKQCEGLRSRYPDYIETTFTHGNDELTIFPQKHTIEDVIRLAMED